MASHFPQAGGPYGGGAPGADPWAGLGFGFDHPMDMFESFNKAFGVWDQEAAKRGSHNGPQSAMLSGNAPPGAHIGGFGQPVSMQGNPCAPVEAVHVHGRIPPPHSHFHEVHHVHSTVDADAKRIQETWALALKDNKFGGPLPANYPQPTLKWLDGPTPYGGGAGGGGGGADTAPASYRAGPPPGPPVGALEPPPASPWPISPSNPKVFLDVAIGTSMRRIVIELFSDAVPRTAENFRSLCTGERGTGAQGHKLHYKGSFFHRVIKGFICQGGDFTARDGTGGESIYVGGKFPDESFEGKAGRHWGLGTMSMANAGPNTNRSQFSMCVGRVGHLDGVHVVFGQVIGGLDWLVEMNNVQTDANDRPTTPVHIVDCGMYEV